MAAKTIKDRAVLVRLSDHAWRGGMIDNQVSQDVMVANNAKKDVGHFWKRLLPKAAIRPRFNAGNAVRAFHNTNTLPWMENGVRILPVANFDSYMAGIRKLIALAEAEERKIFDGYAGWIAEAKKSHGKLFNAKHFPELKELRTKFGIKVDVIPLPNVNDWRVDLADDQVKELRAEAEKQFAAVQAEGIADIYNRLNDLLTKAKGKLDDPQAVFRDSLIGNIKTFVALIDKLNLTGDKNIKELRKEIAEKLAAVGPETLRTDPEKRRKVAKDTGDILKKMSAYMTAAK